MFYTKKDIRSFKVFYKISAALGVIPCSSFDATKSPKPIWKKLQGFLLMGIIIIGTIFSLYVRNSALKILYRKTHVVLDYIDEFFVVAVALTGIYKSCFCNTEAWIKLNNNITYIDDVLKIKEQRGYIIYNASFQFFVYCMCDLIGVSFLFYTWFEEFGIVALETYSMHQFCYLYDVLMYFLIYSLLTSLTAKYNELNSLLEAEAAQSSDKNILISIRKIENIFQTLTQTVDLFNNVFGLSFVFIIGKSISQLLTCLNFIANKINTENEHFEQQVFIANLILALYTLISVSIVMISGDAITAASRSTALLCYKLQEQFLAESETRSELFKFAQRASANTAVITANNYFQINKSTLFGVFSTTTTYFIIILQFNQSLGNK